MKNPEAKDSSCLASLETSSTTDCLNELSRPQTKKRYDDVDNGFDFHVAIFCLLTGVVFGFILAMKGMATRPHSINTAGMMEIPTVPTTTSEQVVYQPLFCLDDNDQYLELLDFSQNDTVPTNDFCSTTSDNNNNKSTNYSLAILQEMEGYSIDGLIYSLYHSFLGSL